HPLGELVGVPVADVRGVELRAEGEGGIAGVERLPRVLSRPDVSLRVDDSLGDLLAELDLLDALDAGRADRLLRRGGVTRAARERCRRSERAGASRPHAEQRTPIDLSGCEACGGHW